MQLTGGENINALFYPADPGVWHAIDAELSSMFIV